MAQRHIPLVEIVKLGPALVLGLGALAAAFKLYFDVDAMRTGERAWRTNAETRREKNREDMDALRERVMRLEIDAQWMRRQNERTHGDMR